MGKKNREERRMSDLIHADELIKILHGEAFKDCDDREIVYSIVNELRDKPITVDDSDRIKMLNEIQHWRDQCRSYERTIVKLSVALMERADRKEE